MKKVKIKKVPTTTRIYKKGTKEYEEYSTSSTTTTTTTTTYYPYLNRDYQDPLIKEFIKMVLLLLIIGGLIWIMLV